MADGLSFICMNIILQVCSPADSAAAVAMTMAAAAKAPMHTLEKPGIQRFLRPPVHMQLACTHKCI